MRTHGLLFWLVCDVRVHGCYVRSFCLASRKDCVSASIHEEYSLYYNINVYLYYIVYIPTATTTVAAAVVDLPQTSEDDVRSARAVRERHTSWSMGVVGQRWRWWMVLMRDKARGLVACRGMPEHFPSVR